MTLPPEDALLTIAQKIELIKSLEAYAPHRYERLRTFLQHRHLPDIYGSLARFMIPKEIKLIREQAARLKLLKQSLNN